jgi:hypothetical protein
VRHRKCFGIISNRSAIGSIKEALIICDIPTNAWNHSLSLTLKRYQFVGPNGCNCIGFVVDVVLISKVGGRPVAIYLQACCVVNVLSIDADVADNANDVMTLMTLVTLMMLVTSAMPISLRLYYQHNSNSRTRSL